MSQQRRMSLVEAIANVVIGYGVALATQFAVFPLVGIEAQHRQMVLTGLAFTAVSLVRSYALRRLFDRCTAKGA
ncbi:hypothetical protein [Pelagovum pacificum]|uniref:Uncharacterized protein n=1 Tax=Pelagovum pacificum TaxID=2588711 RepID=A0A5C5G956_9RHOB|nr:hypothetical protein [Pelagovum pacificum]QQA42002.1 hypothetical protein I8N54_14540 [Pelagovum pacificum]TNY31093.1 hypothetical protein FHY64_13720 [Pelagovum pacificum]